MSYMPVSYCARLVRAHDYDRYLCSLFVSAEIREAWCALFAFNHEIAAIAEIVSEEMIGFIRFAWWREALDEIYARNNLRKHPVVESLANAIHAYHLPRAPFDAMLDARMQDLEKEPFADFTAFEDYCRGSSSALFALCARVAGVENNIATEELGVAWAEIGMARAGAAELPMAELLSAAQEHLNAVVTDELPAILAPFLYTAQFYLKRLEKGKPQGARLRLMLSLWLCGGEP